MAISILRAAQIKDRFRIARSTLHYWQGLGLFPKSIAFGRNFSGVIEHEAEAVMLARSGGATDDEIRQLVTQLEQKRVAALAGILAGSADA